MNKGQSKHMTPKQIAANRRNSRRSTGPKTPQGKARSRLNALQHGILAREAVLQGFWIKESPRELEALHRQFWRQCAPVGALEEMLVEQIVTCYWRKRRVLRAESGEIAQSVGEGVWARLRHRAGQHTRFEETQGVLGESKMKMSTAGLDYMTEILQIAGDDIEMRGKLADEMRKELIRVFGADSDGVAVELMTLEKWRQDNPDRLKAAALKATYGEVAAGFIAERLEVYGHLRAAMETREAREEEERRQASALPSGESVERILRYEGALDRQLFRLLRQLERWQRMRMAGKMPRPAAEDEAARMKWDAVEERGPDECGRGLSALAAGASGEWADEDRMADVDAASGVRERDAEDAPVVKESFRRSRKPGLGRKTVVGNRSERRERAATDLRPAATDLRRRLRAADPDEAAASRNDAAAITKPNDGGSADAETAVSNGNMDVSGGSRPANTTQICETKPNDAGGETASPDCEPGGSLTTTS